LFVQEVLCKEVDGVTTGQIERMADWHRPLPDASFYTAGSVEEALRLVREHVGARFIAGGTALVRLERWGGHIPPTLVYIGRIEELKQIREQEQGLLIGSLVTHTKLRQSRAVAERAGALLLAAQEIAGPAVRNLATIGGNVAINWDLVPALLALDAQVHIEGRDGARTVALAEFYGADGLPRTAPDQLITGISVAADLPRQSYQKIARRQAVSRAIVGAAVALDLEDTVCRAVRIGLGGAGLPSRRLTEAEELLRGQALSDELVARAGAAAYDSAADARPDFEATPWYTREMARVMTERAINSAAGRPVL
jgi:CO/xanthine dehydrogenase FAD-binding subunit